MINLKKLIVENGSIITESVYDKGIFKAIFLAGIPGSGKSYTIEKITDGSIQPRIVNTDKMIEYYSGMHDIDINLDQYYDYFREDVKRITVNQLSLYVNSVLPLFIDGTSNSLKSLFRREGLLRSFGYDIGMLWVETDVNVAVERAKQRNRYIPDDYIIKINEMLEKNKPYYKSHFRVFREINNNSGELNNSEMLKAYREIGDFFTAPIENPVGIESKEIIKKGTGYLVGSVYNDISDIKSRLSGWYGDY